MKRNSKPDRAIEVLGWTALAAVLLAAIVLDKNSPPHKWHAAIMWTGVAFYGALVFGRRLWASRRFWLFWTTCFVTHVILMWLIFVRFLPNLILGTLYVVPLGFGEAVLVVVAIAKLQRLTGVPRSSR